VRAASDAAIDPDAARRTDGISNRFFLEPLLLAKYPDDVLLDAGVTDWFNERTGDLEVISAPIDFLGVNYIDVGGAR